MFLQNELMTLKVEATCSRHHFLFHLLIVQRGRQALQDRADSNTWEADRYQMASIKGYLVSSENDARWRPRSKSPNPPLPS